MNEELASPAWTSDGQEIVFSSGAHSAQRNLWRISATPGNPPRREPIGEDGTTLAISQDGRRLAYSRRIFDADIWGIKLRSRTELAGPPAKLISSTRMDCNPQYSPDGKRIAFNSFRSGTEEVWVANADGTQPLQLTFAGGPMVADPRWSPDGQTLVIHSMLGGVRGIDLISANGGALRRVAEGGVYPTWSRDGKWIYFGRDGQLWKIPSGGGAATQVTKVGTTPGHSMLTERIGAETASGSAFESEDGKFLYYANDSQVRKVALDGGQEIQIVGEPLSFGQNLALVEDGLYLISSSGFNSPGILYFFDFASGRLTPLITIQRWALGLTVSPDRRTILYSQGEQTSSDLMLVENFH
jgi:Tol biopolymer transport system component